MSTLTTKENTMPRGIPNNKTKESPQSKIKWRQLYVEALNKLKEQNVIMQEYNQLKPKVIRDKARDETIDVLSSIIKEAIINKAVG